MYIVIGIALFMFLVVIHELGHFWAAKKTGTKVEEFGIGIPPKLFKYYTDKSWTDYTINLIPLGWFVRLKWEDPNDDWTFSAKDSFIMNKFWNKVLILLAWVIMNTLFAWLVFSIWFANGAKPISVIPSNFINQEVNTRYIATYDNLAKWWLLSGDKVMEVKISDVVWDGLAEQAGVLPGDHLVAIWDQEVTTQNINSVLKSHIDNTFDMKIIRWSGWEEKTFSVTCPEDNCVLGIVISTPQMQVAGYNYPILQSIKYGLQEVVGQFKLSLNALGKLFASIFQWKEKLQSNLDWLTWPAWAIKIGQDIIQHAWWVQFMIFAGMISLSLAIFNVLPIPALDGGRLLGVIIQKIFNLSPKKYFNIEGVINTVFFFLMMWLGLFILWRDLWRFWWV